MVPLALLVTIFLLQSRVQARCPKLNVKPKSFDNFNWNTMYELYQFKSVDKHVQSPFFGLGGDTRYQTFKIKQIKNFCRSKNTNYPINYLRVELADFNKKENKFLMKYRDNNQSYFCEATHNIKSLFVVDFDNANFISFYSCQILMIESNLKKLEGVMIFFNRQISMDKLLPLLNNTYNILLDKANITQESLKINKKVESYENSCMDIMDLSNSCSLKAAKKRFTFSHEKPREIDIVWIFLTVTLAVCITCVLIAKKYFVRNFNRVFDLTRN